MTSQSGWLEWRAVGQKRLTVCCVVSGLLLPLAAVTAADVGVAPFRRSHIQPVGEMVQPRAPVPDALQPLGLHLSRAPEILRRQLALGCEEGLVVDAVAPGSVAAASGFLPHDVLVKLDDQLLVLPEQFGLLLGACRHPVDGRGPAAGLRPTVTILRGGRPLTVGLGEQPAGQAGVAAASPAAAVAPEPPPQSAAVPGPRVFSQPLRQPVPVAGTASGRPTRQPRDEAAVLLREDTDFTIHVIQGDETRLVVQAATGEPVFNGCVDTPAQLATVPPAVRARVEAMLQVLGAASPAVATTRTSSGGDAVLIR